MFKKRTSVDGIVTYEINGKESESQWYDFLNMLMRKSEFLVKHVILKYVGEEDIEAYIDLVITCPPTGMGFMFSGLGTCEGTVEHFQDNEWNELVGWLKEITKIG